MFTVRMNENQTYMFFQTNNGLRAVEILHLVNLENITISTEVLFVSNTSGIHVSPLADAFVVLQYQENTAFLYSFPVCSYE